ncbi:universal stress protein [uncultured Croceitalea sp.]|uniref:universal stress protein n=1 Tax=uncultured Croceitalea sp. TaxID=1798908 RepID=UPI0033060FC3
MKKILLPTDFSKNAYNAIEYCLRLYENATCCFYLTHAFTPAIYRVDYMMGSPGQIGLPDDYKYIAENRLEKLRKQLKSQFNNPRHTFIVHAAFNSLVDEVSIMIRQENIDLVVMGTQGATGAKEIFLGSNTVHVIKKSEVPVLMIPDECTFSAPKDILFPTDFEIDYNLVNLNYVFELIKLYKTTLHIMHVTVPKGLRAAQEKNKRVLKDMVKTVEHVFYDLPDQELIDAINSFEREHKTQLLTMVRNKHTFLERLFIEPIIKKIGFHTMVPFLVLPYH